MGQRSLNALSLALAVFAAGCNGKSEPTLTNTKTEPLPPPITGVGAKVVADFEAAVLKGKDAYVELFDFAAVGEIEVLLHRYDLNGRLELSDDEIDRFSQ